jgi:hypothetical protein
MKPHAVDRRRLPCGAPLGPLAAGFLLGAYSGRTTIAILGALLVVLAVLASILPLLRDAPSLSELKPDEVIEPVVPELAG